MKALCAAPLFIFWALVVIVLSVVWIVAAIVKSWSER